MPSHGNWEGHGLQHTIKAWQDLVRSFTWQMFVHEDIVFAFDTFYNHIFLASALAFDEAKGCFGPITFRVFGDF